MKNTLHDFCAWGPPRVSWKKNLFRRVKSRVTCRFSSADYEYHNDILENSCLVGPPYEISIHWNLPENILSNTKFELFTNLNFLRQKM
jgi:hypothetical protein